MTTSILYELPAAPATHLLNYEIVAVDEEAGCVTMAFTTRPEFTNSLGCIQGGFITAMLDDTMGSALVALTQGRYFASTMDIHVSFLAPARPGRFLCYGKTEKMGRDAAFLEARLENEDGEIIAKGCATAKLLAGKLTEVSKGTAVS